MEKIVSKGIVLSRTSFAEADRIITVLTRENGKQQLIAKGARKIKSKLAGGIELFAINAISYMGGKSSLKTLVSSKMEANFHNILNDYNRSTVGYYFLKAINDCTEDDCGPEYFDVLRGGLESLHNIAIESSVVKAWFSLRLLAILGHQPMLEATSNGAKMQNNESYNFDFTTMSFHTHEKGRYLANDIKFMRLALSMSPEALNKIENISPIAARVSALLDSILQLYLRNPATSME